MQIAANAGEKFSAAQGLNAAFSIFIFELGAPILIVARITETSRMFKHTVTVTGSLIMAAIANIVTLKNVELFN